MALSQAQIDAIYAKRREKGLYAKILAEQLNGEENGFAAKETYPRLAGKEASTIYQGFRNALDKLGDTVTEGVDVINMDDEVFVIFTDRTESEAA